MKRAIALLALVLTLPCGAGELLSSEWKMLMFETADGTSVKINLNKDSSIIEKIEIRKKECGGTISDIRVPGNAYLYEVSLHEDRNDEGETVDLLTIPYITRDEKHRNITVSFLGCRATVQ